jgi:hypothetical protein
VGTPATKRRLSFQGAKLLGKFQINKAVFGFLLYILQKMCGFVGLVQDCNHIGRIDRIENGRLFKNELLAFEIMFYKK